MASEGLPEIHTKTYEKDLAYFLHYLLALGNRYGVHGS